MPNHLRNWTFEDIEAFLKQHHFVCRNIEGSHHFYVGLVDGKDCVCEVQYHSKGSIPPKTLKINIIEKSGIPIDYWLKWSSAGGKRKKIFYSGATKRDFPDGGQSVDLIFNQTDGRPVGLGDKNHKK